MGEVKEGGVQAKLFFGLLASSHELLSAVCERLEKEFSPIDCRSEPIAFVHTAYYEPEMGKGLLRQWVSTSALIPVGDLVGIKLFTNCLETLYAQEGKRRVNIDPGYVALSKVVLATTKDYDHRIYVDRGIYEEVTLHFRRAEGFLPWPWTYPDYRSEIALRFFVDVREHLRQQLPS